MGTANAWLRHALVLFAPLLPALGTKGILPARRFKSPRRPRRRGPEKCPLCPRPFRPKPPKLPPLTPGSKRPFISCPRPASAHLYVQPIKLLIAGSVLQPPYY